jgi:hypothetical protein
MEKLLHLTLYKKFFDLVLEGKKKEEYRDKTEYWKRRLFIDGKVREYDFVVFKNGYARDAPKMKVGWIGLREDKERFAILLGRVVETKNLKKKH